MYDLSSKFNTFYTSYVVLSQDEQNNLHNKKDLNVQRLKDGLKEYNIENNTSYTIAETCVQGSVAMSTVVQNEDGDYDIDVAVVFDKNVLGDRGGTSYKKLSGKCTKTNGHWGQTPLNGTICLKWGECVN
jgi:tRNA nucleotidyltransferase (CCA-adding enzyme)